MTINARVLAELEAQQAWITGLVDGHTKELAARWQQAWNDINQQLDTSYERLASNHPTVSARVKAIRAEQAWQPVAEQITQLARQAGLDSARVAALLAQQAGRHQAALITSQLPPAFGMQLIRDNPRATGWIINRATEQITARHYFLQADAAEQMKQALIRSAALGQNPRETARQMIRAVQNEFNGGLTRALVIARTEQIDAYRSSAQANQAANADILGGWQWIARLSDRTCRSCLAQHGSRHPLSEPGPEDHQQGRCARVPVTKTWAELGYTGMPEPASRVQPGDGEAWLRKQPGEVQDKILGKAGAEAWRDGGWPSSQWSQQRHTDGWRDSYGAAKYTPATEPALPLPQRDLQTAGSMTELTKLDADELDDLIGRLIDAGEFDAAEHASEVADILAARANLPIKHLETPTAAFTPDNYKWFETAAEADQFTFMDMLEAAGGNADQFYSEQWAWANQRSAEAAAKAALPTRRELRQEYDRLVTTETQQLEAATNGYVLDPRKAPAGTRPEDLYRVNQKTANAWATEETKRYWQEHGRPTWAAFQEQASGQVGSAWEAMNKNQWGV